MDGELRTLGYSPRNQHFLHKTWRNGTSLVTTFRNDQMGEGRALCPTCLPPSSILWEIGWEERESTNSETDERRRRLCATVTPSTLTVRYESARLSAAWPSHPSLPWYRVRQRVYVRGVPGRGTWVYTTLGIPTIHHLGYTSYTPPRVYLLHHLGYTRLYHT